MSSCLISSLNWFIFSFISVNLLKILMNFRRNKRKKINEHHQIETFLLPEYQQRNTCDIIWVFLNHVSSKWIIFWIYEELALLNTTKNKFTWECAKGINKHFFQEDIHMANSTGKETQHHEPSRIWKWKPQKE